MAKWFYYNENGDKIEVTGGQLKGLAKAGRITPETIVETEEGKTAPARKVKGLTFGEPAQSESTTPESITLPFDEVSFGSPPHADNLSYPLPPTPSTMPQPEPQPVKKMKVRW